MSTGSRIGVAFVFALAVITGLGVGLYVSTQGVLEGGNKSIDASVHRSMMAWAIWTFVSLLVLAVLAMMVTRKVRFGGPVVPPGTGGRGWGVRAGRYFFAVAVVAIAGALRWWLGSLPPFITLYPAVLLVAMLVGGGPGILASVLATLVAAYFFLPPYGSLAIASANDFLALTIFTCTNLFLCVLAERVRRGRWAEAVAAQKELLAVTLASIGDGVIVTDVQGRVTFLNGEAERLTGWKLAEAQGQELPAVFRIINAESRQAVENPVDQVLRRGAVVGLANHTILIARDGWETPIDDSGSPVREADGTVRGVVLVFRDFSEKKRAEEALRESEERYRLLFETMIVGFCTIEVLFDGDGKPVDYRFLEVNAAFEAQTGLRNAQGKRMRELAPAHEEHWFEVYGKVALTGEPASFVQEARALNRWFDVSAYRIGGPESRKVGILFSDITERKRTEEALRKSEQRYAALFANKSNAIAHCRVLTDERGRSVDYVILAVNEAYERIIGIKKADIEGRKVTEVFPGVEKYAFDYIGVLGKVAIAGGEVQSEAFLNATGQYLSIYAYQPMPGEFTVVFTDITARKRAEEALRQSEEMHRVFFELGMVGMAYAAPDGRLVKVNDKYCEITGYTRQELTGMPLLNLTHPDDREADREQLDRYFRGDRPVYAIEKRYLRKDGLVRWVSITARLVHEADGRPRYSIGIVEDITERKQAEEALRQNRALLQAVIEGTSDAVYVKDPDGRYLLFNTAAGHFTGKRVEEVLGKDDRFLFPRDEAKVVMEGDQAVMATGKTRTYEEHVTGAGGNLLTFQSTKGPLCDTRGKLIGLFGIARNITDLKQAEETIRQSEADLTAAQRLVHIGSWQWDIANDTARWSEETFRIFGITRDPLKQHRAGLVGMVHPDDRQRVDQALADALRGAREYDLDYRIRRPDGSEREIHAQAEVLRNCEGKPILMRGTAQDITERKQAEHELKSAKRSAEQAKEAAEHASKAKDHFLAVLSHELRNPLNPVLATASMLRDDPRFDADTREQLEVICRNAELEARLIDDLLDVTRIERNKVELDRRPVELCTIIRRATEVCLPDIEARQLEFGVDLGPAPYWVEVDAARLQQVFWNLIKNAIKFTPVGGCVGIRCRRDGEGFVVAEVNDSGVGIDAEALGRIFNAFEQAERSITRQFGGLGLGLAISKALVDMHGGCIQAHSQGYGKGATFTVRLPLLSAPAAVSATLPTAEAPPRKAPPRRLRILLVEDHGDTARIMRRLLSAEGHEVQTAGDVATALALAEERGFDLLLSDLGLPDGSGLDLMRALRAKGIAVPGIALSGYGQESDVQQSREAGFLVHLTKPVNLPKLEEAMVKVVGEGGSRVGGISGG